MNAPEYAKPTRHRTATPAIPTATSNYPYTGRIPDYAAIRQDPSFNQWLTVVGGKHKNAGKVPRDTIETGQQGVKEFLHYLNLPVTSSALSDLITRTREDHRRDEFTTDDKLLAYSQLAPHISHETSAAMMKGVFKANRCPLYTSIVRTPAHRTKKIGARLLKAIYESLPRDELRALIDLQAYSGERVAAIARKTSLTSWEDHDDKYVLIHVEHQDTKARYAHICVIPIKLANRIRKYSKGLGRNAPFPNYETLWREINKHALSLFGTRLTSHYLRKRFATIASKTTMPVNSWDYLMGDKPSLGHHAEAYALEDFSQLVKEYDNYLEPYLSISNAKEPDDPLEPFKSSDRQQQLEQENQELKVQLLKLTKLLTDRLSIP